MTEKQAIRNNLPPVPEPGVVGREQELAEITKALLDPDIPIVTLVGLAGIGKTTLALAVAHHLREQDEFPGGIVWLNASTVQSLDEVWEKIREALDLPSPQAARRHLHEHPTLLILDGLDEAAQDMEMLAFLDRLPRPIKALVTSRKRVELRGKERVFTIGALSEEDAVQLFMEIALHHGIEVSAEDAVEICRMLDNIPLAILWVLSYYQHTRIPLEALKQRLAEGLVEPSVETLLRASYERLSEDEKKLFRCLAVFADDVNEAAIEHVCQVGIWKDALERLASSSLVDVQDDRYRLHPLSRQFALARLEETGERLKIEKRAAEHFISLLQHGFLYRVVPGSRKAGFIVSGQYLKETLDPDARNILHSALWAYQHEHPESVQDVIAQLGVWPLERGLWDDMLSLYELALPFAQSRGDQYSEAVILSGQGDVYQFQGRYNEALIAYERSRDIFHELGERYREGQQLNNIGTACAWLGLWNEAIAFYEQSLSISHELGDRHSEAQTLHNLANVYQQQGRWAEAFALYEQSLSVARELGDRRSESQSLNNLGLVYQYQGRYEEAIVAYEQSLAIDRELGDRHGEAQVLGNLATIYAQQGWWAEALANYEEALHVFRTLGDRHGESQTMANLGNVYQFQGRWIEAIEMYKTSLAIKRDLGDRQGEGQTLSNLGTIYAQQGQWAEAISFYEQSLAVRRELGDRYGEGQTLGNMANLYAQQGRLDEAHQLYEHALELAKALGDREGVAFSLAQLGRLAEKQEDYVETVNLSFQSLAVFSELGVPAAEVVRSRLVGLQERLGEHRFWELCGQAGVKIDTEALGLSIEKPTNWVVYFVNLAAYHEQQEDWRAAANTYRQAQGFINLREATADDRHRYAEISHRLGVCLRLDGQWGQAVEHQEETFRQFKKLRDFHGQGRAYLEIARAYQAMNSYDLAVLYYHDAHRLFRRAGDVTLAATAKEELGNLEYYLRILKPATADWEEAARLYEQAGRPGKVAIIRQNLAQAQAG